VQLDHVALTVRDREASAAFYGEHFALTERVHEGDQGVGRPPGARQMEAAEQAYERLYSGLRPTTSRYS
jgi:catechol 2,3-dioxygenase-like lactoylglutathione lyase family enzyme